MCLLLFKTDGEEEVALVRDGSFAPYVGVAEGSDEYESYLNVGSLLYFRSLNFSKSFSFSVQSEFWLAEFKRKWPKGNTRP